MRTLRDRSLPTAVPYTARTLPMALAMVACWTVSLAATAQIAMPPLPAASPAKADPSIAAAIARISTTQIRTDIQTLVSFNNRDTLSSMETDLAPVTGINAAADWVEAEFKRISADCGGCLEVKRDSFIEPAAPGPNSRIPKPTRITNIYAVLKGTDPAQAERRVLVTGHYDSRNSDTLNTHTAAPGANDDASGVAVSLESARVLSKLKFPSTLVFVAVAGEEQGLNGSRHLAKLARAEGWQLEAVLNNDIVGGDTTPGQESTEDKSVVRVFSEGVQAGISPAQVKELHDRGAESDTPSRELARQMVAVDKLYFEPRNESKLLKGGKRGRDFVLHDMPSFRPVMIFRADRYLRGGDHTSFNLEGFPAVRLTEWRENFDHQHQDPRVENGVQFGDLIQYVDMNYVQNVARLNAAMLAELASAPGVPQNVHVDTAALGNDTVLSWDAPAGAPAGTTYEVAYRPTDQPDWTGATAVPTGGPLTVKLPLSKDNFIFGVRSLDAAGHRSIAVYPVPTHVRAGLGPVVAAPPTGTPNVK